MHCKLVTTIAALILVRAGSQLAIAVILLLTACKHGSIIKQPKGIFQRIPDVYSGNGDHIVFSNATPVVLVANARVFSSCDNFYSNS